MYKIPITIAFFLLMSACNNIDPAAADASAETLVEKQVKGMSMYGELNKKSIAQYFPEITDTVGELGVLFSENLEMNPGNGIMVSLLHNVGTFDQMFLCTHDKDQKLVSAYYIGTARDFEKHSHAIEYEIHDKNKLSVKHKDWMQKKQEAVAMNDEHYVLRVDDQGEIAKSGL